MADFARDHRNRRLAHKDRLLALDDPAAAPLSPGSRMAIGHSSTRMLERYTHPTEARKIAARELPTVVTTRSQSATAEADTDPEIAES